MKISITDLHNFWWHRLLIVIYAFALICLALTSVLIVVSVHEDNNRPTRWVDFRKSYIECNTKSPLFGGLNFPNYFLAPEGITTLDKNNNLLPDDYNKIKQWCLTESGDSNSVLDSTDPLTLYREYTIPWSDEVIQIMVCFLIGFLLLEAVKRAYYYTVTGQVRKHRLNKMQKQ